MSGDDELQHLLNHPLLHPVRLAIALYLLPREGAYLSDIAKALGITFGNLRYHLDTLAQHGYIEERIVFRERPRKLVRLTPRGAEELRKIMETLRRFIEARGSGRGKGG